MDRLHRCADAINSWKWLGSHQLRAYDLRDRSRRRRFAGADRHSSQLVADVAASEPTDSVMASSMRRTRATQRRSGRAKLLWDVGTCYMRQPAGMSSSILHVYLQTWTEMAGRR